MYEQPDPEMGKKIEGLRRAVKFGLDNGKRNMIVDLDVLAILLNVTMPEEYDRKPTVKELQEILDCPDKPDIVIQSDGSIRAEVYDPSSQPPAMPPPDASKWKPLPSMDDMEAAWIVIANVSDGRWDEQTETWKNAATKVRERYHELLKA